MTSDDIKLLTELNVDEDASNGESDGDTAPWLAVNASIPASKEVVILAIYYQTSDAENMDVGEAYCALARILSEDDDACPPVRLR